MSPTYLIVIQTYSPIRDETFAERTPDGVRTRKPTGLPRVPKPNLIPETTEIPKASTASGGDSSRMSNEI